MEMVNGYETFGGEMKPLVQDGPQTYTNVLPSETATKTLCFTGLTENRPWMMQVTWPSKYS